MNQRPKSINRQKHTAKLHKIGFGNDSLDRALKVQSTKEKFDKLDFPKIVKIHQKTLSTK